MPHGDAAENRAGRHFAGGLTNWMKLMSTLSGEFVTLPEWMWYPNGTLVVLPMGSRATLARRCQTMPSTC